MQDEESPSAGEGHFFIKMGTYLSYLRIPALASSLIAALASGLLYFKQKYIGYFEVWSWLMV